MAWPTWDPQQHLIEGSAAQHDGVGLNYVAEPFLEFTVRQDTTLLFKLISPEKFILPTIFRCRPLED